MRGLFSFRGSFTFAVLGVISAIVLTTASERTLTISALDGVRHDDLRLEFSVTSTVSDDAGPPQFTPSTKQCSDLVKWTHLSGPDNPLSYHTEPPLDLHALFHCTHHNLHDEADFVTREVVFFSGYLDRIYFEVQVAVRPTEVSQMVACAQLSQKYTFRTITTSNKRVSATLIPPNIGMPADTPSRCSITPVVYGPWGPTLVIPTEHAVDMTPVNGEKFRWTAHLNGELFQWKVEMSNVLYTTRGDFQLVCDDNIIVRCWPRQSNFVRVRHMPVTNTNTDMPHAVPLVLSDESAQDVQKRSARMARGNGGESGEGSDGGVMEECISLDHAELGSAKIDSISQVQLCANSSNQRHCVEIWDGNNKTATRMKCPIRLTNDNQLCFACFHEAVTKVLSGQTVVVQRLTWRPAVMKFHSSSANDTAAVDYSLKLQYKVALADEAKLRRSDDSEGVPTARLRLRHSLDISPMVPNHLKTLDIHLQTQARKRTEIAPAHAKRDDDDPSSDNDDWHVDVDAQPVPVGVTIALIIIIAVAAALVVLVLLFWPARVTPIDTGVVHVSRTQM